MEGNKVIHDYTFHGGNSGNSQELTPETLAKCYSEQINGDFVGVMESNFRLVYNSFTQLSFECRTKVLNAFLKPQVITNSESEDKLDNEMIHWNTYDKDNVYKLPTKFHKLLLWAHLNITRIECYMMSKEYAKHEGKLVSEISHLSLVDFSKV